MAAAALVVVAVVLVALTLRQPEVPGFSPTPATPAEVGRVLVGPIVYTVDAASPDRWSYFSFRLGSVIQQRVLADDQQRVLADDESRPLDWDLAFKRYQVIANGGPGYPGNGAIRDLGAVSFDTVRVLPEAGYEQNVSRPDPANSAIARWYTYGFFSHVLTPKPHVWAVRTADGRYAKIEIVNYYCPGARPGCFTFRYAYQGDGSTTVAPPGGS